MTATEPLGDPPASIAGELVELADALAVELAAVDVFVQLAPAVELGALDVLLAVELIAEVGGARAAAAPSTRAIVQLAPAAPASVELEKFGSGLAARLAAKLAGVDVLVAARLSGTLGAALAARLAAADAVPLAAVDVLVAVELVSELRAGPVACAVDVLTAALHARLRAHAARHELTLWAGRRGGVRVASTSAQADGAALVASTRVAGSTRPGVVSLSTNNWGDTDRAAATAILSRCARTAYRSCSRRCSLDTG